MDYRNEQYHRMQQLVASQVNGQVYRANEPGQKMPFYMTYPIQSIYMTEMEYEADMERMKDLYPAEVKRIQKQVEEECDKMEYDGSLMFDEYPDRLMLKRISDRIYNQVTEGKVQATAASIVQQAPRPPQGGGQPPRPPMGGGQPPRPPMGGGQPPRPPMGGGRPPMPPPQPPRPPQNNGLQNLIEILLFNEMYRRRCRYRRCRSWW